MINEYQWIKFELAKDLQSQLADLMYNKDMTLAGIAEGLGVPTTYVRHLFSGREHLTMRTLIKIVRILGGEIEIVSGEYRIR